MRAGPGSGKTRVIVERAARLIDEEVIRPEQLLVLTFSRKAASDLRQRLADRLRRSYASFPVTTFHAFCFSLLTRHTSPPPRLARPVERRRAINTALAAKDYLGLPPSNALAEEALAFCSLCDEYLEAPEHPLARVRENYVAELATAQTLDYGGLQREAVALLASNQDLRHTYAEAYRHVLVDEYQDTNVAQERLLELIAGEHRNLFCVADEDQSIYGFRGAEIDNALDFEARWNGVSYPLPVNYRSAPPIVELATSVIRRNVATHKEKPLRAHEERPAELRGRLFRHPSEEADWIAREIAALRLEGVELGGIAILARSLRQLGPRLAYSLRRNAIPFHAPLSAPVHPTVDALLSLLELATAYPWERVHGDQALRALGSPLFGADPLELRELQREKRTLFGALRDSGRFEPFFQALAIVKRQTHAGSALYALWDRLDYFRTLQERCRPLDAPREDVEELAAVSALSDAANEFDGSPAELATAYRSDELADEDWLPAQALPGDAVALLTIHQAKGLEWDAVFVCDLVEGRFPALARSQYTLFDRDAFTLRPLDELERARRALEEERRLFYVALTRARTSLYLTATEEAREEAGRSLSRFFLEAQDFLDLTRDDPQRFVSSEEALVALRRAGGGPKGWDATVETANENPMLPSGGLRISASSLSPYEGCPLQFYFGSLLELVRPRGAALVFGGIVHDTLEAFHNPDEPQLQSLDRLLELGVEHWREGVITPAALEAEYRRKLARMLIDYHASEGAPDGSVLAVERSFRVALDASTLSGRIDRIDRRPDGSLRLVDYKSGKPLSVAEAESDLQLALYAVACAADPELAELGVVGELVYLFPAHLAWGKVTRRSQSVTPDLVESTRERVQGLVAEIVAERFDFSPTADCTFCNFQRICPRHFGGDVPV